MPGSSPGMTTENDGRLCFHRTIFPPHMRHHPYSLTARGRRIPFGPLPSKRGRAERRTRDASAVLRAKVRKHTGIVTTAAPVRPAFRTQWFFRLASCSPRRSSSPRGLRVSMHAGRRAGSPSPDALRRASGPHDLGRRAKASQVRRISALARNAQRRRQRIGNTGP